MNSCMRRRRGSNNAAIARVETSLLSRYWR
jgi:hypothetical protein